MSQKTPAPSGAHSPADTAAPSDPAVHEATSGANADAEPTVIKDRRFWQRRPQAAEGAEGAEGPHDAGEAGHDASAAQARIDALEQQLQQVQARLSGTVAQYKEALDEFEGTKLRLRRDVAKEIDAGKKSLLSGLLDVLDNLERAIDAAAQDAAQRGPLLEGVTMVRDQFMAKLEALGVRKLEALGLPFDPTHFEAISTVPVADPAQNGMVVGVVREGYALGAETLRHGMVAVGKQA
jgi:molecular chaperone GrpE